MIEVAPRRLALSDRARERWTLTADILAAAMAVSLPWSTSATGILAALLLIAILPTLDFASLKRLSEKPAVGLPALFWLLALIGTLWAIDVPVAERYDGLKSLHKLLFIPILMAHFQRSGRGIWVLYGFVASCVLLLVASFFLLAVPAGIPGLIVSRGGPGIPVKDYITQSGHFAVCSFLLAGIAVHSWKQGRYAIVYALSILSLALLANVVVALISRTALIAIPVLFVLFAFTFFQWKSRIVLFIAGLTLAGLTWILVADLRGATTQLVGEVREYTPGGSVTRAGERIEFWRKSMGFVLDAPLIGHGTGSIKDQFRRTVEGQTGVSALASSNPHNQTFAVAIQWGLLGAVVLFAMWIAHWLMFQGPGLAAWAGLVVVSQNVIGSLFNSHLFDFTQGWGYVLGVGVAAGMVLRDAKRETGERPRAS